MLILFMTDSFKSFAEECLAADFTELERCLVGDMQIHQNHRNLRHLCNSVRVRITCVDYVLTDRFDVGDVTLMESRVLREGLMFRSPAARRIVVQSIVTV